MDEESLRKMLQRTFTGDCTGLVRQLARLVLAERGLNKTVLEQMQRDRCRVIHLEGLYRPVGRVLMVDWPPTDEHNGILEVYSDPLIRFLYVQPPMDFHGEGFEGALEAELRGRRTWENMPWEIGPAYHTTWTRRKP